MEHQQIIIRLAEEPRAVELEIAAPIGTRAISLDEKLMTVGARAIGTIVFSTTSRVVLLATLVEANGAPLDANRIGEVLEVIKSNLTACTSNQARAA